MTRIDEVMLQRLATVLAKSSMLPLEQRRDFDGIVRTLRMANRLGMQPWSLFGVGQVDVGRYRDQL